MRIVGGTLARRRLRVAPGLAGRPTQDRVREALASALDARGHIQDARVLDLFAGTGALSFEMLSRGAASALLIDRDPRAIAGIEANAQALDLPNARALRLDVLTDPSAAVARIHREGPFSLVFADPPWVEMAKLEPLLEQLASSPALGPHAVVAIEHPTRTPVEAPSGLASMARYRYGGTSVLLAESTSP